LLEPWGIAFAAVVYGAQQFVLVEGAELLSFEGLKIAEAEELRVWVSSRASGKSIRHLYAVSHH
jgi:hypothetical protein